MYKKKNVSECMGALANATVNLMNEGICFFIFHQPDFPEKARRRKKRCNGNLKNKL